MFEVLSILSRWIKPILLVTILAAVISTIGSLLMPNYYESIVVFQPSNPGLLDRSIFKKEASEKPVYMFGTKIDIDRILSLGESSSLIGYAIDQYKLYNHYDIDPDSREAEFKVAKRFMKNYVIQKNAKGAVEIRLMDKNPRNAADWANDLANKIDKMNMDIIFGKKRDQVAMLESEVKNKQKSVAALTDSLQKLIQKNPKDTISHNIVRSLLKNDLEDLKESQSSYDQSKAIISKDVKTLFYFEHAVPAKRKAKPVRSMIVIGCTLFAFVIMLLVAIFAEKYKEYQLQNS